MSAAARSAPLDAPSPAESLGAEITRLCSYLYAAEYRLLKLIREFDEREYWASHGFSSCAHWLNVKCGLGMNAARERIRIARALPDLPKISAATECGRLSYSKVRAMTRVADASNEDFLMRVAEHGSAYHVETLVAKYRRARRLMDAQHANTVHAQRELKYYYNDDSCLIIRARLPAERGALVLKALQRAMELGVSAETSTPATAREPASPPELAAARRADALADVAETYLVSETNSGTTADRYQVVVHVSEETREVQTGSQFSAETPEIENGPPIAMETSRRISCDSAIVFLEESADGEPHSIGRKARSVPVPIRRALKSRDHGCRFPGCTRSRFVDAHHIRHWANGGETSLDNLVLLCRRHHRLVHEGGFRCDRTNTGEFIFRSPQDVMLDDRHALPGVPDSDAIERWLDQEFFEAGINSESCVARWYAGDTMDWNYAVSLMFPRKH